MSSFDTPTLHPNEPTPPGFFDRLADSKENFKKIGGWQRAATVMLTVLAGIPTLPLLGIGGFYTFMGCADYFARRNTHDITNDKKTPLIDKIENSFKGIVGKKERKETAAIQQRANRLMDLDDEVDRLHVNDQDCFAALCKIREDLANQKAGFQGRGSDLIDTLLESIDGKLAVKEVEFFEKNQEAKIQPKPLPSIPTPQQNAHLTYELKIRNLSFENLDKISEARELLEEFQKQGLTDLEEKLQQKMADNAGLIFALLESGLPQYGDQRANETLKLSESSLLKPAADLLAASQTRVDATHPKGIKNIGNSCYMNSAIQFLIGNAAIKAMIMNPVWPEVERVKERAIDQAYDVNQELALKLRDELFPAWEAGHPGEIGDLTEGEQVFIDDIFEQFYTEKRLQEATQAFVRQLGASKNPRDMQDNATDLREAILATPQFAVQGGSKFQQHDAAEVVTLLFDKIGYRFAYNIVKEVPSKNMRHVDDQSANILPIEMRKGVSVQGMIDAAFETAVKGDAANDWGGEHRWNETVNLGDRPPEQIAIQFKRFQQDDYGNYQKNTDPLAFPKDQILNLSKAFGDDHANYRITGAIRHGGDRTGGHYRAYTQTGRVWYEEDDSQVNKMSNMSGTLSDSYIIMLTRI